MNTNRMKRVILAAIWFFITISITPAQQKEMDQVDVCVYGGTSAGVMAAYSAKKMGKTVLLIEPGNHLGGLSSGGLGFTDIGNKYVVTGLAKDFYRKIGAHYGQLEQWVFEPHVAENTFKNYIRKANIDLLYQYRIAGLRKNGNAIKTITLEPAGNSPQLKNRVIAARVFIDCSYEGDLMARAGVSYTVGREANAQYGETYNGVQLMDGHQFPDHIDPYRIPGDAASGLIWGISNNTLMPDGSGDRKVQSYNYRICLTNNPQNREAITKPQGYDSTHYELLVRLMAKQPERLKLDDYFIWSEMPNQKTDINNRNGFSTDMIGLNHSYPDGNYQVRAKFVADLKLYTQGLLYFFGHDERVPMLLRNQMLQWGYPRDEYKDNGNWSFQPYIREARRMTGAYVMTEANCTGKLVVRDGIGWAAYNMDSHNCDRLVVNGMVKNEGNVEIPDIPPYPISYRAIVPKEQECRNLLVPVCLSASHIAYGSIRMEPVFMVLAQVAGVAASMAIEQDAAVQGVDHLEINKKLTADPLLDGSTPELIVDNLAKQVETTGNWNVKAGHAYGPNAFYHDAADQAGGAVTFYTGNLKNGEYEVFSYYPVLTNGADETAIQVFDGKVMHRKTVHKSRIKVVGQTSGEWVSLGTYRFAGNARPFVRINSNQAGGITVADAILFKPVNSKQ